MKGDVMKLAKTTSKSAGMESIKSKVGNPQSIKSKSGATENTLKSKLKKKRQTV